MLRYARILRAAISVTANSSCRVARGNHARRDSWASDILVDTTTEGTTSQRSAIVQLSSGVIECRADISVGLIHASLGSFITDSRSTQITRRKASCSGTATTRSSEILYPNLARISKISAFSVHIHGSIDTTQVSITRGVGTHIGSSAIGGCIEITEPISLVTGEHGACILVAGDVETFALGYASSCVDEDALTCAGIASSVLASKGFGGFAVGDKIIIDTSTG